MRKIIITALFLLGLPCLLFAQNYDTFTPDTVHIELKTFGTPGLFITMPLSLGANSLDVDYYHDHPDEMPKFVLSYKGKRPNCPLIIKPLRGAKKIGFAISNLTDETINRFLNKENGISVEVLDDIHFAYGDATTSRYNKVGVLKKADVNKLLTDSLTFPADQRTKFLTAFNNLYYYKNKVDFGVQPGKDSASVSYTLNVDFQNVYGAPSLIKCDSVRNGKGSSNWGIYYGLSARLSTNSKDSLNYLKVYPVMLHTSSYKGKLPFEFITKLGHESNETFSTRRVALDASFTTLIPNLVDLTSSANGRLRLKPVIGLGIKGYYDYSNSANLFTSGQAYLNGYYYIPVYDQYAIILNDETFYDFSKEKNPNKKLASNYSIAVGTEVPGTSFKVMFKYENGKSDINYKQSEAVVIGLIMNLFTEKPTAKSN